MNHRFIRVDERVLENGFGWTAHLSVAADGGTRVEEAAAKHHLRLKSACEPSRDNQRHPMQSFISIGKNRAFLVSSSIV